MKIVKIDLNEIRRELGAHFAQVPEEEHIAYCTNCSAKLTQDMDECPACGIPVVWFHSSMWKELYGTPGRKVKELSAIMPQDRAGKYLMYKAGLPGFKEKAEADQWTTLSAVLNQSELSEIINFCARRASGRGLIKYVLNAAAKKAASLPEPEESGLEIVGGEHGS